MFKLNETLEKDTFFIKDLPLCQLLLMNNKFYPWLILVPKRPGMVEIFDLNEADQKQLMAEISLVSRLSKDLFQADKINIAAFGNVVSQLHIHIICRYKNDRVFPSPIWLDKEKEIYDEKEALKLVKKISEII